MSIYITSFTHSLLLLLFSFKNLILEIWKNYFFI